MPGSCFRKKDSLTVLAFHDTASNNLTIVGINTSGHAVNYSGNLANLPSVDHFEMYHTNSTENLHKDADINVWHNLSISPYLLIQYLH